MPTIIDSLFLQLGIDVSQFSEQQRRALAKIKDFESASKRGADKAAKSVKTVGSAFKDLAADTQIGAAGRKLDSLATRVKAFGQSAQLSGPLGAGPGKLIEGLGALLSPAALAAAAIGVVGGAAWDLNKRMTAVNSTLDRQAKVAGMSAKQLWSWGQAAKTVGESPEAVTSSIAGLQTAIIGGMIGVGSPSAQLTGLARLGVKWNPRTGVNIKSLFERVHQFGKVHGWAAAWALASGYGLMNQAEFNLAMSKNGGLAAQRYAKSLEPGNFSKTLKRSLQMQSTLGRKDITSAALAEQAYGGINKPMQTLVGLITGLLAATNTLLSWTIKIAGYIGDGLVPVLGTVETWIGDLVEHFTGKPPIVAKVGSVSEKGALPSGIAGREGLAMRALMSSGASRAEAAGIVGNMMAESGLKPTVSSDKGAHIGLMQLDAARQKQFEKTFAYRIGSPSVPKRKQFLDELLFSLLELRSTQQGAAARMAKAKGIAGKAAAFYRYDERPGVTDRSLPRRITFAEHAAALPGLSALLSATRAPSVTNDNRVTNTVRIGSVAVNAPKATDASGVAAGMAEALKSNPLIAPIAQQRAALGTTGVAG
ncbi:MAG: phage tail tip lysozyme [Steroidobacteraceae bacterium]